MNTIPTRFLDRLVAGAIDPSDAREATGTTFDLLVLSGGTGTGKTLAACEWLRRMTGGWFITSAYLARYPRYDAKAMRDLLEVGKLVIDDLGCEYMDDKGNFMAVLDEVINARFAERLPTLLTTNLDAAGFKERYGARIADRIREDGRFLALGDTSFRPRMAAGESEAIRGAAAKADAEKAEATKAAERQTCALHLYGKAWEPTALCNPRCGGWSTLSEDERRDAIAEMEVRIRPMRDLVRSLADLKGAP